MEECEKDMEEGEGVEKMAAGLAWKSVSKFNLTECQGIKRFLFFSLSPPSFVHCSFLVSSNVTSNVTGF